MERIRRNRSHQQFDELTSFNEDMAEMGGAGNRGGAPGQAGGQAAGWGGGGGGTTPPSGGSEYGGGGHYQSSPMSGGLGSGTMLDR